jgi:hypothetical protein
VWINRFFKKNYRKGRKGTNRKEHNRTEWGKQPKKQNKTLSVTINIILIIEYVIIIITCRRNTINRESTFVVPFLHPFHHPFLEVVFPSTLVSIQSSCLSVLPARCTFLSFVRFFRAQARGPLNVQCKHVQALLQKDRETVSLWAGPVKKILQEVLLMTKPRRSTSCKNTCRTWEPIFTPNTLTLTLRHTRTHLQLLSSQLNASPQWWYYYYPMLLLSHILQQNYSQSMSDSAALFLDGLQRRLHKQEGGGERP